MNLGIYTIVRDVYETIPPQFLNQVNGYLTQLGDFCSDNCEYLIFGLAVAAATGLVAKVLPDMKERPNIKDLAEPEDLVSFERFLK